MSHTLQVFWWTFFIFIAPVFVDNSASATATFCIIPLTVGLSSSSISPSFLGECPHSAPSRGRGPDPPSSAGPAWTETGHHGRGSLGAAALPARERARTGHWAWQQTLTQQSQQSQQSHCSQWPQRSRPLQTSLPSHWTCGKMLPGNSWRTGNELSWLKLVPSLLPIRPSVFLFRLFSLLGTKTFSSFSWTPKAHLKQSSSNSFTMFCLF